MKKILTIIAISLMGVSANAIASSYLETNSLVVCEQSIKLSDAIDSLNLTVTSPEVTHLNSSGFYVHIKDFTVSAPVITVISPTSTSAGGYAACVTLTRKDSWLASK